MWPSMINIQTHSPGSNVPSAINSIIIQGGDESVVKLAKTALRYNVFLVTIPTQPHSTRDAKTNKSDSFSVRW